MNPSEVVSSIEPKKKWFDVDLKGLWRYRDLYYMYIKRDIVTQYKQTVLGPIWLFIAPILTTIVYMFVFGGLAGISTDGVPQPLFYMAGISLWNYFNTCFGICSTTFAANAGVFGKVYFPRLVVPLSACTSNLVKFLIQFSMFVAIYVFYAFSGGFSANFGLVNELGWAAGLPLTVLVTIGLVLMVGLLAMSWGLIISSWTTKYRDLTFLITFGVQLLMYATPVIYPVSFAPESYRPYLEINPLTPVFEAFKFTLLGTGTFDLAGLLTSVIVLLVTLVLAVIIFNRTEQKFMDTV
ncbi:MAG: ABC transporter permease [Bacteroidales bacterium]|nr:ABC transporter permease [Bacteroidales bacterium]